MRIDPMSRGRWERPSQSHRRWARRAPSMGIDGVNISEDVRKYAAAQNLSEEEALKKGMEEKSKEFAEKGAELYTKA
jgi:hypothetical protein